MKKLIIFMFIICFVFSVANAAVIPTEKELNICLKAFDGTKSYWALVLFFVFSFVFTGCVFRLLYVLRHKKKDVEYYLKKHNNSFKNIIVAFVAGLSLVLMIHTFRLLPHKNPPACLDYRICEEQYELYKYNINLWCYENIHLINNHWNSTNSVCLNECLALNTDKNSEPCKKCEQQHWQFKVFKKFKGD